MATEMVRRDGRVADGIEYIKRLEEIALRARLLVNALRTENNPDANGWQIWPEDFSQEEEDLGEELNTALVAAGFAHKNTFDTEEQCSSS